jgi:hypothetical protein
VQGPAVWLWEVGATAVQWCRVMPWGAADWVAVLCTGFQHMVPRRRGYTVSQSLAWLLVVDVRSGARYCEVQCEDYQKDCWGCSVTYRKQAIMRHVGWLGWECRLCYLRVSAMPGYSPVQVHVRCAGWCAVCRDACTGGRQSSHPGTAVMLAVCSVSSTLGRFLHRSTLCKDRFYRGCSQATVQASCAG